LVSHEGLRCVELVMQDAPSEYISVKDVIVEMTDETLAGISACTLPSRTNYRTPKRTI